MSDRSPPPGRSFGPLPDPDEDDPAGPLPPEAVEGSPERAADRGRDFLGGAGAFGGAGDGEGAGEGGGEGGGGASLGDPDVVDALVRGFGQEVAAIRADWHRGAAVDGSAAAARVAAAARAMAAVFMGRDRSGHAPLAWNSPEHLGAHLKERFGWVCPDEEAAAVFFDDLARRVLNDLGAFERDEIGPEQARFAVESAVEDASLALLGLPQERTA